MQAPRQNGFKMRKTPAQVKPTDEGVIRGQDIFWLLLIGAVAGFLLLVFKPNRDAIREARAECELLEIEIKSLTLRVEDLRRWERSLITGDRDAWSLIARERLGLLAPGERVVSVEDDDSNEPRKN